MKGLILLTVADWKSVFWMGEVRAVVALNQIPTETANTSRMARRSDTRSRTMVNSAPRVASRKEQGARE